ncbi:hypothetical protein MBLNU230_g4839t1 [Neophaeotheca triangularis]
MGSEQQPVRQSGIYRNLPTFDASIKGLKALVIGATGISGFNTMRSLLDSPDRWETIFAVSRNAPSEEMLSVLSKDQRERIKHVSVDLKGSAQSISESLKQSSVVADYVFFFGYIHPENINSAMDPGMADALVESNVPMFKNFLSALDLSSIKPKRILLQTGGKNYGAHIGQARLPYTESDPQPKHLSNNFYYHQEAALFDYCEKHPGTDWNIVMPSAVIGAVPNAAMNSFVPFAVMAAVQAEKKQSIFFPGDFSEWQAECTHSTSRLTGYLCEWAVLEEKCKNQRFNAQDGAPLTWNRFFPELARWYGVDKVEGPLLDDSKFQDMTLAGGKDSPMGFGPAPAIRLSQSFGDWAKDESNSKAWKTIMEKSDGKVQVDVFEKGLATEMADFVLYRIGQLSPAKVRRMGFNGFVDTLESVFEMYHDMAKMGVLLAPKVDAATPMV